MVSPRCTSGRGQAVSHADYGGRSATSRSQSAVHANISVSSVSTSVPCGGSTRIAEDNRRRLSRTLSGIPRWSKSPRNRLRLMPRHKLPPPLPPPPQLPACTPHPAFAIRCLPLRIIPTCSQERERLPSIRISRPSSTLTLPKTSSIPHP